MNYLLNFLNKATLKILYSSPIGVTFLSKIFFPLFTDKKTSFHKDKISWFIQEDGLILRTAIFRRFRFYHHGLKKRLTDLAEAYGVNLLEFDADDVVIDCGANIGELGCYLKTKHFNGRYIAIEPDDKVNEICKLNNSKFPDQPFNLVLSDQNTEIDFFISSELADSSAITPSQYTAKVKKAAKKLDTLISELNLKKVKLFKLEAEGFEPEVLKGAQQSIKLVKYVAIDCGPERYGKDTIVDCFNMLFSNGFSLLFSNFERGTFLFINGATVS